MYKVPDLYKNANCRNIGVVTYDNYYKKQVGFSKLDGTNYSKILMDREFENLLDARIFYAHHMLDHYRNLKMHLENMLELSLVK